MTEQPVPQSVEDQRLRIERALRAAARAGNRMLAGGLASVEIADPALNGGLRTALARMGVRIVSGRQIDPPVPVEFAFSDTIPPSSTAEGEGRSDRLPAVRVALSSGSAVVVDSPRGEAPDARIAWAAQGMPVTADLAEQLRRATGTRAPRVAVSLVLEPKTAAFTLALAAAGCEVALFSAVNETDPDIAAALAATGRVAVFAPMTDAAAPEDRLPFAGSPEADARDAANAAAILDWGPELLIDDGSHLVRLAHTERPEVFTVLRAAAEETTSGVRPLHEMAAAGDLRIPVIAVNDARTKMDFDNLIGTGQSCVFAIGDLLDSGDPEYQGIAGTRWAVLGYGPVGRGVARFAAALGAEVTVVERDPVRALSALHDGYAAAAAVTALPEADVVVSATGVWHTLDAAGFAALRPGAVVAVAGGIDDELALDDLRSAGWASIDRGPRIAEWRAPGAGSGPLVLAEGGGVNYSAGEGNPIEVMDLSFATQLAALLRLLAADLPAGVHALSGFEEEIVARAALRARGGSADRAPATARPGGAAQHWAVHRYRSEHRSDQDG